MKILSRHCFQSKQYCFALKSATPGKLMINMNKLCICLALAASFFSAAAISQEAVATKSPYKLIVWADVGFDENSQLSQVAFPEKDSLPAAFVGFLTNSITTSALTAPENTEANKQLESGLRVTVEIDPNTSRAKILSRELMPRPLRSEQQIEPLIRVKGEWAGRIFVTCTINRNGRCSKPKIDPSANAPTEISKVLLATLGSWRFAPQKRAGIQVDGEFNTSVTIEADNSAPPKSFGKQI